MLMLAYFLAVLFAILSFYLGYQLHRRKEKRLRRRWLKRIPRRYFVGLNFLLNDEADKAVDIFTKMLDVDSGTIETHLAVAKLFRRTGEIDRAIRIHQHLIARTYLPKRYREQSMYELGTDYLSAGVLDRAEKIFLELAQSRAYAKDALRTLIDLYQQEKDWHRVLKTLLQYEEKTQETLSSLKAHAYCEIAEQALAQRNWPLVEEALAKVALIAPTMARLHLLNATFFLEKNQPAQALTILLNMPHHTTAHFAEFVRLLERCEKQVAMETRVLTQLESILNTHPNTTLAFFIATHLATLSGRDVALSFVLQYARQHPSLHSLSMFTHFSLDTLKASDKADMLILQNLLNHILSQKSTHQCKHCGFSSHTLNWQCPGCRKWETGGVLLS